MRFGNIKGTYTPRDKSLDTLQGLRTYVSKATFNDLKEKSKELNVPVARLIAIAIDNEKNRPDAFNFDLPFPTDEYEDGKYYPEALKLYRFMGENLKEGISYDMLMLCRQDIGISDKAVLLQSVRELLMKEFIEEVKIKGNYSGLEEIRIKLTSERRRTYEKNKVYREVKATAGGIDVLD